jgi:biotin carboxylase
LVAVIDLRGLGLILLGDRIIRSRFGPTDKRKAIQPSRSTLLRPDTTRPDKTLRKQVETNKSNKPYVRPMIAKCFKYGEQRQHSSDCRR